MNNKNINININSLNLLNEFSINIEEPIKQIVPSTHFFKEGRTRLNILQSSSIINQSSILESSDLFFFTGKYPQTMSGGTCSVMTSLFIKHAFLLINTNTNIAETLSQFVESNLITSNKEFRSIQAILNSLKIKNNGLHSFAKGERPREIVYNKLILISHCFNFSISNINNGTDLFELDDIVYFIKANNYQKNPRREFFNGTTVDVLSHLYSNLQKHVTNMSNNSIYFIRNTLFNNNKKRMEYFGHSTAIIKIDDSLFFFYDPNFGLFQMTDINSAASMLSRFLNHMYLMYNIFQTYFFKVIDKPNNINIEIPPNISRRNLGTNTCCNKCNIL